EEIEKIGLDQNGERTPESEAAYLAERAAALAAGLELEVAGTRLPLVPISSEVTFPPGAGGLPTTRLSILYRAPMPIRPVASGPADLSYRDRNDPGRTGWKEMAAAGREGVVLVGSSLPATGSELRAYPEKGIQSPPQVTESRFSFEVGPGGSQGAGPFEAKRLAGKRTLRDDRFTALMTGAASSVPIMLLSFLIAFGLGALHALSPGHGKTVVAAYLVGSRGTARHALLLGLIVTMSHTAGVFALGLATLSLSRYIVPERLYPWLGLFSGVTIAALGLSLFIRRWRTMGHRHGPAGHSHGPGGHSHDHPHPHSHPDPGRRTLPGLLGLGVTGGIIPCPSALVVLLSAIAFHRVAFGLLLIVAFSAGLAATLVGIGLMMVYLGGWIGGMERLGRGSRLLPVFSAAAVTLLGGIIAAGAWFQ